MVILKITFDALPQKYKELEQALSFMSSDLCIEYGCKQADLWRDSNDENRLHMVSHWDNQKELDVYFRSDIFSALMGTKVLLKKPPSITIDKVISREGTKAVVNARSASKVD